MNRAKYLTSLKGRVAVSVLAAVLALGALTAIAAAEKPTTVKAGNLVLTINGGVTPKALSKTTPQPIALNVEGKFSTVDGSQPPAIKQIVVDTDRNGTIDARGAPVCKQGQLEALTTAKAEAACKAAIIGTGTTDIEVEFPEQGPIPVHTQLTAFNGPGGGKGKATILVHAFLTVPIPAAVVTTVKVTPEHKGPYGTHSVASVPKIAGGSGSVKAFNLTFSKHLFAYKGKKHGYLLAKCDDGSFVAEAETVFANGEKLGGKIARACTPKG
jgi:hypothetical protein